MDVWANRCWDPQYLPEQSLSLVVQLWWLVLLAKDVIYGEFEPYHEEDAVQDAEGIAEQGDEWARVNCRLRRG